MTSLLAAAPPSVRRTGAHALIDALVDAGVDTVFGYPGGTIMPVYDALHDDARVRHVLARHEANAAFAAGGFARASGRVGVCMATSGPGATNLITGLLDAQMDSIPLVAITAQVRTALLGTDGFQEADVTSIAQAATKRAFFVRDVAEIGPVLARAFALASGPRGGAVLVDIPTDVLKSAVSDDVAAVASASPRRLPTFDRRTIESAVAILRAAQRPLAIAGGGVKAAGAVAAFRAFIKETGIPHAATINGLGSGSADDPQFLGMVGMHGWRGANRAIQECDVLLAFGMRFDDRVTGRLDRFAPQARIVHFDIDVSELGKLVTPAVAVGGDLAQTLPAFVDGCMGIDAAAFHPWRTRVAELHRPLPADRTPEGVLAATDAIAMLVDEMPAGTIVATDVGQHQMWTAQRARPLGPRDFLTSGGLGSMGFGLPAAIGAAFARLGTRVVAVVGDGGVQMSLAEFATLRREGLDVKVVVIDNQRLGMVRQWQHLFYERRYAETDLSDNPDFVALAHAYGIPAHTVRDAASCARGLTELFKRRGPALLHVVCHPEANCWPMIPAGASLDDVMEREAE